MWYESFRRLSDHRTACTEIESLHNSTLKRVYDASYVEHTSLPVLKGMLLALKPDDLGRRELVVRKAKSGQPQIRGESGRGESGQSRIRHAVVTTRIHVPAVPRGRGESGQPRIDEQAVLTARPERTVYVFLLLLFLLLLQFIIYI
jgi:hypothetical protein